MNPLFTSLRDTHKAAREEEQAKYPRKPVSPKHKIDRQDKPRRSDKAPRPEKAGRAEKCPRTSRVDRSSKISRANTPDNVEQATRHEAIAPSSPPRTFLPFITSSDPASIRQNMLAWMFNKPPTPVSSDPDYVPLPKARHPKPKPKRADGGSEMEVEKEIPKRGPLPPRPERYGDRLPPFTDHVDASGKASIQRAPVLSWVIQGPMVRGRFDGALADALGIPFGPARGKLIAGQAITVKLADGGERTVQPEEVVGAPEPPKVVLVLDVPSVDYLPSLTEAFGDESWFARFKEQHREERHVHAVFHLLGDGVLEDARYKDFINSFPSDVEVSLSLDHDDVSNQH
jgi:ribonuclease Z